MSQPHPVTVPHLIEALSRVAARDFPVREVRALLDGIRLPSAELAPYRFLSAAHYTRNLIHKSEEFELLLLVWAAGQRSPIHGHEGEKCWTRVEEGELHFTSYREKAAGDSFRLQVLSQAVGQVGHVDGPADIHEVANRSELPAVTLHLYARPYDECDVYDLERHTKTRKKLEYFSRFGRQTG